MRLFSPQSQINSLNSEVASGLRKLILAIGVLTTGIVVMNLQDPINLPKFCILVIFSAWVLGTVVTAILSSSLRSLSLGQIFGLLFILGLLIAALATDVRYIAFFGTGQRNNGFLSYFAFATLSIGLMMSVKVENVIEIFYGFVAVGLWLTGYGVLQLTDNDPLSWVNMYGPIVGTLGNPDFFSALLGSAAIAMFAFVFLLPRISHRALAAFLLLVELFILYKTESIQGLVAFLSGATLITFAKIYQFRRHIALIGLSAIGVLSIPIALGFLGFGPLAEKLQRSSLSVRVDYWQSAIGMFKAHPLLGVGLDRFVDSYFQYAPAVRTVQTQVTDNAHNVFLQFLSTGGLVLTIPYILLLLVIFVTSLRAIKKSINNTQIVLVALFSIWMALLMISFISIDQLGVVVWFWISGGALYGASRSVMIEKEERKKIIATNSLKTMRKTTKSNFNLVSPLVSLALTVVAMVIILPAWKASNSLNEIQNNLKGLNAQQYVARLEEVAKIQPSNIQLRFDVANYALKANGSDLALKFSKEIIAKNPRSYYANYLSALVNEALQKPQDAIPFRMRMLELYPNETANLLAIVEDYIKVKDLKSADKYAASMLKNDFLSREESVAAVYEAHSLYLDAITFRQVALDKEPSNPAKVFPVIKNYMKMGDFATAKRFAAKVSTLEPGSENEVRALDMTKQYSTIQQLREKALLADPSNFDKMLNLIYIYITTNEMTSVRELLSKIPMSEPSNADKIVGLMRRLIEAGYVNDARLLLSKISKLKPGSEAEAQALEALGDYAIAVPIRIKLVPAHPKDPSPWFNLASDYIKLGQRDKAEPLLKKVLEFYPSARGGNQAWWQRTVEELVGG